jgi:hypothetical protein
VALSLFIGLMGRVLELGREKYHERVNVIHSVVAKLMDSEM